MLKSHSVGLIAAFTIAIPSASAFWSDETETMLPILLGASAQPIAARFSMPPKQTTMKTLATYERREAFLEKVLEDLREEPVPHAGVLH